MSEHITNGFDGRLKLPLASIKGPTHGVVAELTSPGMRHLQSILGLEPHRVPIGTITVLYSDRVILRILISPHLAQGQGSRACRPGAGSPREIEGREIWQMEIKALE